MLFFTFLLVNNNKVGITNKYKTPLTPFMNDTISRLLQGILEIKRESIEKIKIDTWGFIILLSLYFSVCLIFSIIEN